MSWFSFEICRILICEICNDIDLGPFPLLALSKTWHLLKGTNRSSMPTMGCWRTSHCSENMVGQTEAH